MILLPSAAACWQHRFCSASNNSVYISSNYLHPTKGCWLLQYYWETVSQSTKMDNLHPSRCQLALPGSLPKHQNGQLTSFTMECFEGDKQQKGNPCTCCPPGSKEPSNMSGRGFAARNTNAGIVAVAYWMARCLLKKAFKHLQDLQHNTKAKSPSQQQPGLRTYTRRSASCLQRSLPRTATAWSNAAASAGQLCCLIARGYATAPHKLCCV
jgi:hypothetical protein